MEQILQKFNMLYNSYTKEKLLLSKLFINRFTTNTICI